MLGNVGFSRIQLLIENTHRRQCIVIITYTAVFFLCYEHSGKIIRTISEARRVFFFFLLENVSRGQNSHGSFDVNDPFLVG